MPRTRPRKTAPTPARRLERVAAAVDALRAGRGVRLEGSPAFTMFAAETPPGKLPRGGFLVLSHARAKTLKIRLYSEDVVALPLDGLDAATIRAIADPTADLSTPLKGPFKPRREKLPDAFAASVKLAGL